MKRTVGRALRGALLCGAMGLIFSQFGCHDKDRTQVTSPAQPSSNVSGLSAAGGVSNSSKYVLISTTAPVAIHTRTSGDAGVTATDAAQHDKNTDNDDANN